MFEDATDRELLAAVFDGNTVGDPAMPLEKLLERDIEGLAALGLERASGIRLLAIAEIARRCQPGGRPLRPVLTPRDALTHFCDLRQQQQEALAALMLDGARVCIGVAVVGGGSTSRLSLTAKEVFSPAVRAMASSVILAHNHPAGTNNPSPEDRRFTADMVAAGAVLGIEVDDHLIVARRGYFSFRAAGLLQPPGSRAAGSLVAN